MWSKDGLLVACVMDRVGILVADSVGCVFGSVYVGGGITRVKSTCEILRHVLNKIHISIYSGTSLKGLSVLRTQYKKPPY